MVSTRGRVFAAALGACAVALGVLALTGPATGHIVGNTTTVRALVAGSDLVVHARVVRNLEVTRSAEAPGVRPGVEVEVVEVLKGSLEGPERSPRAEPALIRFAQHGHGVARFTPGEETLVFLVDIARSRELDALGRAGDYAWVSLQEGNEKFDAGGPDGPRLLAAVRDYVRAERQGSAEERLAALRRGTVALLASEDARLASAAVRDLVTAPSLALVTADDLPALEAVLDDPGVAMGVRLGLMIELERRGLLDGTPRWTRWLAAGTPSQDRIAAARAAGGSGRLGETLVALLDDPDEGVAAAAAIALGSPRNASAVPALAKALASPSRDVRMAAIRGLGGIGSPEALEALAAAARDHADPATRRRAQAETRKRSMPQTDG